MQTSRVRLWRSSPTNRMAAPPGVVRSSRWIAVVERAERHLPLRAQGSAGWAGEGGRLKNRARSPQDLSTCPESDRLRLHHRGGAPSRPMPDTGMGPCLDAVGKVVGCRDVVPSFIPVKKTDGLPYQ